MDVLNHVNVRLITRSWLCTSLGIVKWDIEEFFNLEDFRCSLDQLPDKLGLFNQDEARPTRESYLAKNSIAFNLGNTLSV